MLKDVIKRIADELVSCQFDPNKTFKLVVKLQTLGEAMDFISGYQQEDVFFGIFPEQKQEAADGESE